MHDLVLIHGWGMNAAVWQPLLQPLSARFRLHRLELPGHGEQPFAGERSLRQWAETLLAQAPEQACWLGWSLGGQVALQAALLAPQRVRALLLCASVPHFTRSEDWPNALPVGTLSQFAEQLKQDYHATLGRFLALQVRGSEQGRAVLRQLQQGLRQRPEADPEALDVGLQLLRNSDLRDPLTEIRCPVYGCFGARDSLIPAAVAEDLQALAAGVDITLIEGAGHAPFLSHPQPWLAWVERACS